MASQDIPQTVALASIGKKFNVTSMQSLTIQSDPDKDIIRLADDNIDSSVVTHSDAERSMMAAIVELLSVIEGLDIEIQELRIRVEALEAEQGGEPEGPAGYDLKSTTGPQQPRLIMTAAGQEPSKSINATWVSVQLPVDVILEREDTQPASGSPPGSSRINRQVFLRKLRSDMFRERKAGRSATAPKLSDIVSSHYADTEPNRQEADTDAESSRSLSPAYHPQTTSIPPHRDAVRSHLGNLASGHGERRPGLRFSSEPPREIPENITFPAPSMTAKDSTLQPLRRPFKDKDSEGCTTWYTGSSNSPIAQPPSTVGVHGDLYLHNIRGTDGPPLIWLMDDQSTWQRVQEGCTHLYITDRCLRIRGSGRRELLCREDWLNVTAIFSMLSSKCIFDTRSLNVLSSSCRSIEETDVGAK
ncbi:hypothetical protein BDN71DRAFT_1427525 [Pleurotus eryngii]|uniref:Uncharacterized protein n=1 Tax=Pleurotus eryngii TaxID=5323 RepID=A0A9P6A8P9_PLEER|nr:hypothetical protein BDN71DRAFT_1427525 [Pleurotus eryngii]